MIDVPDQLSVLFRDGDDGWIRGTIGLSGIVQAVAKAYSDLTYRHGSDRDGDRIALIGRDYLRGALNCDDKERVLPLVYRDIGNVHGFNVTLRGDIENTVVAYCTRRE